MERGSRPTQRGRRRRASGARVKLDTNGVVLVTDRANPVIYEVILEPGCAADWARAPSSLHPPAQQSSPCLPAFFTNPSTVTASPSPSPDGWLPPASPPATPIWPTRRCGPLSPWSSTSPRAPPGRVRLLRTTPHRAWVGGGSLRGPGSRGSPGGRGAQPALCLRQLSRSGPLDLETQLRDPILDPTQIELCSTHEQNARLR